MTPRRALLRVRSAADEICRDLTLVSTKIAPTGTGRIRPTEFGTVLRTLFEKRSARRSRARRRIRRQTASRPRVQRFASTMAPPPPHAASAPLRSGRTGDLDGNLNRVKRELRRIRFPVDFDGGAARQGSPMALLPALHYAMLGFSRHVTSSLSEAGHDLRAKSDARFVENAWRALREEFGYNPALTPQQFLSPGFAERKLMLLFDAIELCKRRHNEHARAQRGRESQRIPRVAREAAARSAADATSTDEPVERRVPIRVERAPRAASAHADARVDAARVNADARVDANARARATNASDAARDSDDSDGDFEFRPSPGRAPLADVVVPPEEAAERAWFASTSASSSVPASPSASTRLGGSGGRLGGGGAVVPPSPPPGSGFVAEDDERPGTRTDALRDGLRRSGGFANENAAPRGGEDGGGTLPSDGGAFDAGMTSSDVPDVAAAVAAVERRAAEAESRAAAAVDIARFAEVRAGEAADVAAAASAECDDARRKIAALSSALAEQTAKTMLLEGRVRMLEEGAERAAVGYVSSAGVRASREREKRRASGGKWTSDATTTTAANERKKESVLAPAFVDVVGEAEDAVGARNASGSRGESNSAYSSYYGNLSGLADSRRR